jgi:hypothetical protein
VPGRCATATGDRYQDGAADFSPAALVAGPLLFSLLTRAVLLGTGQVAPSLGPSGRVFLLVSCFGLDLAVVGWLTATLGQLLPTLWGRALLDWGGSRLGLLAWSLSGGLFGWGVWYRLV